MTEQDELHKRMVSSGEAIAERTSHVATWHAQNAGSPELFVDIGTVKSLIVSSFC